MDPFTLFAAGSAAKGAIPSLTSTATSGVGPMGQGNQSVGGSWSAAGTLGALSRNPIPLVIVGVVVIAAVYIWRR